MGWFWQDKTTSSSSTSATSTSEPAPDSTTNISTFGRSISPTPTPTPSYLNTQNILPTLLLTTTLLLLRTLYTTHLRRIPNNAHIPPSLFHSNSTNPSTSATSSPFSLLNNLLAPFRRRTIFGITTPTLISDPDNFRLYHTPLGRLALFSTPLRPIPTTRAQLKGQTLSIRIAGIDAPELAHFGKPAQPHAEEALGYLRNLLADTGRGKCRVQVWRRDQYERVVGVCFVRRRWLSLHQDAVLIRLFAGLGGGDKSVYGPVFHVNVGLSLVLHGYATVYEGKIGVEFGGPGMEAVYREAERMAKREGRGMWADLGKAKTLLGVVKEGARQKGAWWLPWTWFGGSGKSGTEMKEGDGGIGGVETPRQYKNRMKQKNS